ncbi:MAG: hypothetical protein QOE76_2330 [Frankiales bacterium]|nr:hypothetical protein [Frankiales bacterium]
MGGVADACLRTLRWPRRPVGLVLAPLTVLSLLSVGLLTGLPQTSNPGGDRLLASYGLVSGLTNDAGGTPLFDQSELRPGTTAVRCITITESDQQAPVAPVSVAATAVTGELAAYLQLTISAGSGGGFGDCSDFAGTTIFAGSLAALAQQGDLQTGWQAAPGSHRTFEVTATINDDNGAQNKATTATLAWTASDASQASGVPSPSPAASGPAGSSPTAQSPSPAPPTPEPATSSAGETQVVPQPTQPPRSPAAPGPNRSSSSPRPTATVQATQPRPSASVPAASTPDVPGGGLPTNAGKPAAPAHTSAAPRATGYGALAAALIRNAVFPLWLLLLVLLFLLVQDRIDRRDPKLALAPTYGDPLFPFASDPEG